MHANHCLGSDLCQSIANLELMVRTTRLLRNENIWLIGDLIQRTERELLKIPGLGRKSLQDIKNVLPTWHLSLGADLDCWPPENYNELVLRAKQELN